MSRQAEELLRLQQQSEALRKLMKKAMLTVAPLDNDLIFAVTKYQEDTTNAQFWGRTVIRCLCANIEARLYVLRRTALQIAEVSKVQFTKEETEILTEIRTKVVNGVSVSNGVKRLPVKDSVKESLRLFAKAAGATFIVDCGTAGCKALIDTFEVRHRLMHPKDTFALGILKSDIDTAEQCVQWVNQQYTELFDQTKAQIAAVAEKQRKAIQEQTAKRPR